MVLQMLHRRGRVIGVLLSSRLVRCDSMRFDAVYHCCVLVALPLNTLRAC
jgi:hypothetical protein